MLVPSVGLDFTVQEPVYRVPDNSVRDTLAVQTLPKLIVAFFIPDVASVNVALSVTTSFVFAFVCELGYVVELEVTNGLIVSIVTVLKELPAMLFEVSFTRTLYAYEPSLIEVLFIEQVVPAIDMETFAFEPPSFVSSRQLFGLDSVNVKLR